MLFKKIIDNFNRITVIVIDDELNGKKLETLDFSTSFFYNLKKIKKEELREELKKAYMGLFFGDESVGIARLLGLINDVREVDGIKVAMFLRL